MNINDSLRKLQRHPVVQSEIAMETQLGFPWLEQKNGKLCLCFRPHRETFSEGKMLFFPVQYQIKFIFPSWHVALFQNKLYSREDSMVNYNQPVCQIEAGLLAGRYSTLLNELYSACEKVLTCQEKENSVSNVMLEDYQNLYWETVDLLGLRKLYE